MNLLNRVVSTLKPRADMPPAAGAVPTVDIFAELRPVMAARANKERAALSAAARKIARGIQLTEEDKEVLAAAISKGAVTEKQVCGWVVALRDFESSLRSAVALVCRANAAKASVQGIPERIEKLEAELRQCKGKLVSEPWDSLSAAQSIAGLCLFAKDFPELFEDLDVRGIVEKQAELAEQR